MSIIRYATAPEQPWRNSRGVTRELHSGNGWRLSLATLDRASEFSTFPGLNRVLVIAGGTLELTIDTTTHLLRRRRPALPGRGSRPRRPRHPTGVRAQPHDHPNHPPS